jgi:hypothetical protein
MKRARLTYIAGNEHDPADPFGRHVLTIEGEAAHLDHTSRTGTRKWSGPAAPAVLDRLWAALARAGFPAVAAHPIPAGATMRVLEMGEGDTRQTASIEWHAATQQPGYDEAFQILDSIMDAISMDKI